VLLSFLLLLLLLLLSFFLLLLLLLLSQVLTAVRSWPTFRQHTCQTTQVRNIMFMVMMTLAGFL
jgi:hypothetical protein